MHVAHDAGAAWVRHPKSVTGEKVAACCDRIKQRDSLGIGCRRPGVDSAKPQWTALPFRPIYAGRLPANFLALRSGRGCCGETYFGRTRRCSCSRTPRSMATCRSCSRVWFEDDAGVVVVEIWEPVVADEVDGVVVALLLIAFQAARHESYGASGTHSTPPMRKEGA